MRGGPFSFWGVLKGGLRGERRGSLPKGRPYRSGASGMNGSHSQSLLGGTHGAPPSELRHIVGTAPRELRHSAPPMGRKPDTGAGFRSIGEEPRRKRVVGGPRAGRRAPSVRCCADFGSVWSGPSVDGPKTQPWLEFSAHQHRPVTEVWRRSLRVRLSPPTCHTEEGTGALRRPLARDWPAGQGRIDCRA